MLRSDAVVRFWIDRQARDDLEVEKDRLGAALDNIQSLSVAGSRQRGLSA
jgi:hypothetical protein